MTAEDPGHGPFLPPGPPADRWEALLAAERAPVQRLIRAFASAPLLRRLFRVPARFAEPRGSSLHEREELVQEIGTTKLARRLGRVLGAPMAGDVLDHEIQTSLELLRTVPLEELQRQGWSMVPNHWAWPLNDVAFLRARPDLWRKRRMPADIDFDLDAQEELAKRIAKYAGELSDVRIGPASAPGEFVWDNGTFGGGDGYAYYGLVRELRPRRVIEVGAGSSSLLLARALGANGDHASVTVVEPEPKWGVMGDLSPDWRIVTSIAQDADLTMFEELEAGDFLFYDGSHCVRTGSDVNWMLFEVFPRLAPGVWIHLHDIFWPDDYPAPWILDGGLSWNEQYFLQAFLMNNPDYRVRLAVRMLWRARREQLAPLFPVGGNGGSVWIEKLT